MFGARTIGLAFALVSLARATVQDPPAAGPMTVTIPNVLTVDSRHRYELTYDSIVLPFEEHVVETIEGGYRVRLTFRSPRMTKGAKKDDNATHDVAVALSRCRAFDFDVYMDERDDVYAGTPETHECLRRNLPKPKDSKPAKPAATRSKRDADALPSFDSAAVEEMLRKTRESLRFVAWADLRACLLERLHPFAGVTFALDRERATETELRLGAKPTILPAVRRERVTQPDSSKRKVVYESTTSVDRPQADERLVRLLSELPDPKPAGMKTIDDLADALSITVRVVLDLDQNLVDEVEAEYRFLVLGTSYMRTVVLRRLSSAARD